jgi:hypothetical protein
VARTDIQASGVSPLDDMRSTPSRSERGTVKDPSGAVTRTRSPSEVTAVAFTLGPPRTATYRVSAVAVAGGAVAVGTGSGAGSGAGGRLADTSGSSGTILRISCFGMPTQPPYFSNRI